MDFVESDADFMDFVGRTERKASSLKVPDLRSVRREPDADFMDFVDFVGRTERKASSLKVPDLRSVRREAKSFN